MRRRTWLLLAAAAVVPLAMRPVVYRRVDSPDGRWYAVATSAWLRSLVPVMPGQAGDRPGAITVYARDGTARGTAAVDMVQAIGELRWDGDGAEIPLVARWDLARGVVTGVR